jgi:maleylpyruvate isomerase
VSEIAACRAAHGRLLATVAELDDEVARRPSRLPGWTVGHVLTHVARNADGHRRRVEGALRGEDLVRYPDGMDGRNADIEAGAGRPAGELAADVAESARLLEEAWDRAEAAGWPNGQFLGADTFPVTGTPLRRLREVEVHHVDLGLGYEPADWPGEYVDWELPRLLARLPERLDAAGARRVLAWLTGRGPAPADLELPPWM